MRTILLLLLPTALSAQTHARYAERLVDIRPYLRGDEIISYRVHAEASGLFVLLRSDAAIRMRLLSLDMLDHPTRLHLNRARDVFPSIDLAQQHIDIPRQDRSNNKWIVRADTANDEQFDLFETAREDGTLRRITTGGRVLAWFPGGVAAP